MITVSHLCKSYGEVQALRDFSYTFDRGIYAVLGPNGSGKSTLMNLLTQNAVKTAGEIQYTASVDQQLTDGRIGYVPQYPGMYPSFTVYEMLDYIGLLRKNAERHAQIEELLTAFDLTTYRDRKVKALSGGTKQRLAIAQAFLGHPELVILDEPTAGLDPLQRVAFKNYTAQRSKELSVIISTHIVSDVESIATEVIFLQRGQIARAGTMEQILDTADFSCWQLPLEKAPAALPFVHRVNGGELRILSEDCPCADAMRVRPELEDCYLAIFGMERAHG